MDAPVSAQDQAIKLAFDETVGEDFLYFAYQPQFVFARGLFHIAITENHNSRRLESIDFFLDDWVAFYKAQVEELVPSEASDQEMQALEEDDTPMEDTAQEADPLIFGVACIILPLSQSFVRS